MTERPIELADYYLSLIASGEFGPVRVGADLRSIEDALGPGETGRGSARRMSYALFFERHLQVWFMDGAVQMFGLYFRDPTHRVVLPRVELSNLAHVDVVCEWLAAEGCEWSVVYVTDDGESLLRLRSGASVVFAAGGMLDSIQMSG